VAFDTNNFNRWKIAKTCLAMLWTLTLCNITHAVDSGLTTLLAQKGSDVNKARTLKAKAN